MRRLGTIIGKELVENFRERRALLSALIFGPLFGPFLFAIMISLLLDKAVAEFDQRVDLAVSGTEKAPNLVQFLEQHEITVKPVRFDAEAARRNIRDGTHPLILVIPDEYPERLRRGVPAQLQLFSDGSDNKTGKYASRVRQVIDGYGSQIGSMRLLARGVDPEIVRAVVVDNVDVSTPAGRSVLVLGMMTYFILFAMLMGGLYLAIDATAGERERGSLESLLTLPVRRQTLIYGKILATCLYMLLSLAITLIAFAISLRFVELERMGMSANFDWLVAGKVFLVVAPFVLLGASLMTVVASFTRSYKEAQSYLTVVLLVPTLPIVFAGLYSLRPTPALMAVPSLSQHLLMTGLLRDEPLQASHVWISAVATLAIGLVLAWLAGRLYRREAILG
jgi:sodium transport system permease protein